MRILIVEDDSNKRSRIVKLVRETLVDSDITERSSYQSGLATAMQAEFDLLILDMSMPTYDTCSGAGGTHRRYAGRDILRELSRKKRSMRAIVVTQFESFGEGSSRRTIEELRQELSENYSGMYDSIIYYHAAQSDWHEQLGGRILEIHRQILLRERDQP